MENSAATRDEILTGLLRSIATTGLIAYIPSLLASIAAKYWIIAVVDTVVYLLLVYLSFSPRTLFRHRLSLVVGLSLFLGTFILFMTGPDGAGYVWLILSVVISALFGQRRAIIVSFACSGLIMGAYGLGSALGLLPHPQPPLVILVISANIALVCFILTFVITRLFKRLMLSLEEQSQLARRLEEELGKTREAKEELANSLVAKEALLKELDHRVRNNMQLVLSLLNLDGASDASVRAATRRVKALSVVNDLFLSRPECGTLELAEIVRALLEPHCDSEGSDSRNIATLQAFSFSLEDGEALPIALGVSEILCSLSDRFGASTVSLKRRDAATFLVFSLPRSSETPEGESIVQWLEKGSIFRVLFPRGSLDLEEDGECSSLLLTLPAEGDR